MHSPMNSWIQFGCGLCAPIEWRNYDSSPRLQLERLPLLGTWIPAGPYGRFPSVVQYGDIVKGLPIADASAGLLYCSHVLEHLSLDDLRTALRNCRKVLREGGVFRLVVPDLETIVEAYRVNSANDAAIRFMEATLLGRSTRSRGLIAFLKDWLGNDHHLWMWDEKGLESELIAAGFTKIRRAQFNDSIYHAFRLVEDRNRWEGALGLECE